MIFLSTVMASTLIAQSVAAKDPFAEMDAEFEMDSGFQNDSEFKKDSTSSMGASSFQSELEQFKREETSEFDAYKKKFEEEFKAFKAIYEEEHNKYTKKIEKTWDKPVTSSRKVWVEYSDDLKERRKVDFENKNISIAITNTNNEEQASDDELRSKLKDILVKNKQEAFEDDVVAQAVEKRSKQQISLLKTAEVKPVPVLLPFVSEKPSLTDKEIDDIVDRMLAMQVKTETVNTKGKTVVSVVVPFEITEEQKSKEKPSTTKPSTSNVKDYADLRVNKLPKPARHLRTDVSKYAAQAKIDESLVFAIIETESAFNPMAKSPVPAYGLMQIVPTSAGQDATAKLFGKAKILAPSYLYESEKNIEIGTTYLNILYYRYLRGITNEESRLYCSIAAYNTGAGNVAKAFTGKLKLRGAVKQINKLEPREVFDHLVKNLPYDETKKYLLKVHKRIAKYKTSS